MWSWFAIANHDHICHVENQRVKHYTEECSISDAAESENVATASDLDIITLFVGKMGQFSQNLIFIQVLYLLYCRMAYFA